MVNVVTKNNFIVVKCVVCTDLTYSQSHTHTHTHTYVVSLMSYLVKSTYLVSLSSHTHSHTHSLYLTHSHTHTHTLDLSHSHTHTHSLSHTLSLTLSITHTLSISHTHSLNLTLSHSLTHTHSLSRVLFRMYWFPTKVMYSAGHASMVTVPGGPFFLSFNTLLWVLYLMQVSLVPVQQCVTGFHLGGAGRGARPPLIYSGPP